LSISVHTSKLNGDVRAGSSDMHSKQSMLAHTPAQRLASGPHVLFFVPVSESLTTVTMLGLVSAGPIFLLSGYNEATQNDERAAATAGFAFRVPRAGPTTSRALCCHPDSARDP
jgi:hypothetical protein